MTMMQLTDDIELNLYQIPYEIKKLIMDIFIISCGYWYKKDTKIKKVHQCIETIKWDYFRYSHTRNVFMIIYYPGHCFSECAMNHQCHKPPIEIMDIEAESFLYCRKIRHIYSCFECNDIYECKCDGSLKKINYDINDYNPHDYSF